MKKFLLSLFSVIAYLSSFATGHVATAVGTNVTCNGLCNGSATAYASGGVGPYGYTWTGPASYTATGQNITGLCAGTYVVTAIDSSDMSTALYTLIINQPPPLASTTPGTVQACLGSCITLNLAATGGTPPYTYNWTPSTGLSCSTCANTVACPSSTTTYSAMVTDANGCTSSAFEVVLIAPPVIISINPTPTACGMCNGSAVAAVTGGSPPYAYYWTGPGGPQTTQNLTNLCAGTYTLTVTDVMGCSATAITTIAASGGSGPQIMIDSITPSSCSGQGAAYISVTGGTSPYSFLWTPGGITTEDATMLAGGVYNVTVTDASGCSADTAVTIPTTSPVSIVLDTLININCGGASSGTITVHGIGGTAPYTYLWNNGATTPSIGSLSPGAYYVTVTDNLGCTAIQTFLVSANGTLFVCAYSTPANCTNNGMGYSIAAGGIPPYTYLWSNGDTTQNASGLAAGTYFVTITDATGCSTTGTVYIWSNCYNIIRGRVYNDINGNCIQDVGENGISGRTVYTTLAPGYGYTNSSGDYMIYTSSMTETLTHNNPLYSNVICPAGNTQSVNFTTLGDTATVDFADQYISGMNDLQVTYYPGVARPGFTQYGYLWYKNVGTTTISGVVITLSHDSILTYQSSYPLTPTYSYPTLTWNIGTLTPGQVGYINNYYTVPTIPLGGYIGRVLHYNAQITPVAGDQTPLDNVYSASTVITASYDPNIKEVMPAGNITASDSVLHYTIHFQNTGTDTAFTVVLKDTLSQYLDVTTVEPGIASHPYTFNIAYNGELTWTFNNIYLVDSATNEPASHGFASFTVKQKAGNTVGLQIDNTASIYFDFNPAVVTNTVTNMLVSPSAINEQISTNGNVTVYPNPFTEATTFAINSDNNIGGYTFELYDILGKKVAGQSNISSKQFTLNRNNLQDGVYFYKIYSSEDVIGIGKIIIK